MLKSFNLSFFKVSTRKQFKASYETFQREHKVTYRLSKYLNIVYKSLEPRTYQFDKLKGNPNFPSCLRKNNSVF